VFVSINLSEYYISQDIIYIFRSYDMLNEAGLRLTAAINSVKLYLQGTVPPLTCTASSSSMNYSWWTLHPASKRSQFNLNFQNNKSQKSSEAACLTCAHTDWLQQRPNDENRRHRLSQNSFYPFFHIFYSCNFLLRDR